MNNNPLNICQRIKNRRSLVQLAAVKNKFLARLLQHTPQEFMARYGSAVAAVAAGLGLRLALNSWSGPGLPTYVTFYPAIMAVALLAGFGPGLIATVLADFAVAYWVLPPIGRFPIASPADRLGLMIFTGMGLFMSVVAELYRRNRNKVAAYDSEAALRENKARLAAFAEATFEGIVESEAGRIVDCNEQFARMMGYSVAELKGMEIARLIPPEERDRVMANILLGRDSSIEQTALCKDGTRIVIEAHGRSVSPGSAKRHTAIRDITGPKKAEEKLTRDALGLKMLAESAIRLLSTDRPGDLLREIFDALADHLGVKMYMHFLVTEDGSRLHLHSERGLDPAVVKQIEWINFGQTLCGTVAQDRRPMMIEHVQQSIEPRTEPLRQMGIRAYACHPLLGHRGLIGTLSFCAEDRDRFRNDEVELMRITSHQVAMALEHQRLTAELERRAAELAEANAAKDHFLAVLSHELRTPLTPVVMGISLLQDRQDLDPKIHETLEMVRNNVKMEARLIDDLLDVTRIARGKIELSRSPVDLCMVIQRAVEVCKPDIEARRLHFGVELGAAGPYWVEGDESRLEQVFWNLLKNAIKFTPNGGCVGIRCRPSDNHVLVEVNDSGIGIEPEALSRIFDAFEQAEQSITRQFGGLGLGLAISKALVELHGGEIQAHSKGRDKGSTFSIRLPLSAPAGQSLVPNAAVLPVMHATRPLHILLVEDHGITAQMIRMVLAEKGHTVETAGDVSTALRLADRHTFDLLLSDLGLPDASGHDLMRELRMRGHKFPGIALSGYGQEDDVHRSYQAGFAAHLTKPASREAVTEAVASVAAGNGHAMPDSSTTDHADVPVFDADAALKRCFGKREMLQEMVKVFPTESTELLRQMRAGLANGDIAETGRAAHRLRGTVVFLGAQPASDAALKAEQAAKAGDVVAVANAIIELEKQVELLKKTLIS